MVDTATEVPESQAEGSIKSTYSDIRDTLRLPYVPDLLRALAVYPNYLQLAWIALKPNVQAVFFERQCDAVRQMAADLTSRFPRPQFEDQSLAPSIKTLWYAIPKELAVAAVLRSATNGEQPRLRALHPDDKRRLAPGAPQGAVVPVRASWEGLSEDDREILHAAAEGGGSDLPPEYAALASSPSALRSASKTLNAARQDLEYRRIQRMISAAVEQAVTALPFRMDISPHVLRHGGLSESEIDAIRDLLSRHTVRASRSIINVAVLAGSSGESPFPAEMA